MNGRPLAAYYESVHKPYYVLVHTKVRPGHDRFDRYASKPDGLIEFMLAVVEHLTLGQHHLLDRMCELDEQEMRSSNHRKRRYVAKSSEALYNPVQFKGYQFSTNADKRQALEVISLACRVIDIPFYSVRGLPDPSDA